MNQRAIVWFRQDLRISDNPALYHAALEHEIVPIYIIDDADAGSRMMGGASRWWLHHSLRSLDTSMQNKLNVYSVKVQPLIYQLVVCVLNNLSTLHLNNAALLCLFA